MNLLHSPIKISSGGRKFTKYVSLFFTESSYQSLIDEFRSEIMHYIRQACKHLFMTSHAKAWQRHIKAVVLLPSKACVSHNTDNVRDFSFSGLADRHY